MENVPSIEVLQFKTMLYGGLTMFLLGMLVTLVIIGFATGIIQYSWKNWK